MTVRVYPSKLDGEPLEYHATAEAQTVDAWLQANVKGYRPLASPPISAALNGRLLDPNEWGAVTFGPNDTLDLFPEPKAAGAAFIAAYGAYIAAAIAVIAVLLMPKPATGAQKGQTRGNPLEEASAKGNKVKINSPIREVSGEVKVYPDYLLPPRRFYESKRQQAVEMLLCIGKGEFDLPASRILVGDTPLVSLGDDATFEVFAPGADVIGNSAGTWWHSAAEVGPTSTGSAGLELTTTTTVGAVADADSYIFDGDEVTIPAGAGSFPAGWTAGMLIRVELFRTYSVVEGGPGLRDIIEGDLSELAPFVGMQLEIVGANSGLYVVESFTPGSPDQMTLNFVGGAAATGLLTGDQVMALGYANMLYRLTAAGTAVISLERLTDTGATDLTWPGFDLVQTSLATLVLDESNVEGNWLGPFAACPENEVTDTLEYDVLFPGGLIKIGSKGQNVPRQVRTELQWRDMATAGAWTSVGRLFEDATQDQIGFTYQVPLGSAIRPEVRMRRIGAKSTSAQIQDAVQWYGLRAKLQAPSSYAGVTTMAVRIRGGNQLATKTEAQISCRVTRKLPVPDGAGGWTAPQVTRDIVPWVRHVAQSVGYTDGDLDLDELLRLQGIWSARGDYFDYAIDSPATVKAVINNAFRAGFAELMIDRGKLRPARDEPRTVPEHMYTPQNMTEPLVRQFQAPSPDDFDGVDVEYLDADVWAVRTVKCRLPGDIGRKVEKLSLEGVTDRTRAWRIGMRQRRATKYRRWAYTFATELDALNSRYLGFEALADDVPGYGQSAILLAAVPSGGSVVLESSEPFKWDGAGPFVVAIRRRDGTLSGPYPATRVDDYRLTVPAPLDFTPDTTWQVEPPHLLFGPLNRWHYPALITDVSPQGTSGASVSAMNYDARVYADDDNTPPAE